jgi:hypothetical protein
MYDPMRDLTPGIHRDNPRTVKAIDLEEQRQRFEETRAKLFERQLEAGIEPPGEFATPSGTPGVDFVQEAVEGVEPDEEALQPPTTPEDNEATVRALDPLLRSQTRQANQPAFDLAAEQVARAFGELPEEVRVTQASDELIQANLDAAVANPPLQDPVQPINEALERGLIEVEEAMALRRQQIANDQSYTRSIVNTIGQGGISLMAGLAEIGAQFSAFEVQRNALAKVSDELTELSEGVVTGTKATKEFSDDFRDKVEQRRQDEGAGLFEAVGAVSNQFGGRQGGKFIDSFIDEVAGFFDAAADDPSGAFLHSGELIAGAVPSLVFMMGTGAVGSALKYPKAATFIAGSSLETGSNLIDAAHDDETGARRNVPADDLALAVVAGTMAGSLEAVGAMKVLNGMSRATRASKSFRRLSQSKKQAFWREVGRGLKDVSGESFTEGGTEVLQAILSNAGAKIGWRPEQELTEGIVENFIGGFGAGGLMTVAPKASNALRARREAGRIEEADDNAGKYADVSSEALFAGIHFAGVESEAIALPIPESTEDELAGEINRRAIYLSPEQMATENTQELLDEFERRALPGEQNILFVTDDEGVPVHRYVGRDNIEQILNDAKKSGKQIVLEKESQQAVAEAEETGEAEVEPTQETEEGEAVADPIKAAVVTIPDAEGNLQQFEGVTHAAALEAAALAGVVEVDTEGTPIIPAEANIDLFITEGGELLNRQDVKDRTGKAAAENVVPQAVDEAAEIDAEARIRAKQPEAPVIEPDELEALERELEQVDEELAQLETVAAERDSGDLTGAELDRQGELEDRQTEIISKLPVVPITDEEFIEELKEFAGRAEKQKQMSPAGLEQLLFGDASIWQQRDLERMLELDTEQKILNLATRRALARQIGRMKQRAIETVPVVQVEEVPTPPVVEETKAERETRRLTELNEDLRVVANERTMPSFREGDPIFLDERTYDLLQRWS